MKAATDPRLVSIALLATALMLGVFVLRGPIEISLAASTIEAQFERLILLHATLPRLVMAVIRAGATSSGCGRPACANARGCGARAPT